MTEQEQIKAMTEKMKRCFEKNGLLNFKWFAEALVQAGYGDISGYEAEREMLGSQIKVLKQRLNNKYVEIEQLKSEFKQLETNAEILAWGVRDLNHENYELTEKVKQAQIDVLNKLKERAIGYTFLGEKLATETDIDELIKEVENEN